MKVAYFGGDWFTGCLPVLQANKHEIVHVFTDGEQVYNEDLRRWCKAAKVPYTGNKPGETHMHRLLNEGVELLFCVEYPWKIPCTNFPFKTINVHPSMLPHGRGPNPISWSLLKYPQHAGVSFHKLADDFDTGDIIYQQAMPLTESDDLDSYLGKLEEEIPEMLHHLCQNFDELYVHATKQTEGSYWPKITLDDRKLTWTMTIKEMQHVIRASGQFGVVVIIDNTVLLVKGVDCLAHQANYPAGTLFQEDDLHYYIAATDGICRVPKGGILERSELSFEQ